MARPVTYYIGHQGDGRSQNASENAEGELIDLPLLFALGPPENAQRAFLLLERRSLNVAKFCPSRFSNVASSDNVGAWWQNPIL
jgi:hypothetical protein